MRTSASESRHTCHSRHLIFQRYICLMTLRVMEWPWACSPPNDNEEPMWGGLFNPRPIGNRPFAAAFFNGALYERSLRDGWS